MLKLAIIFEGIILSGCGALLPELCQKLQAYPCKQPISEFGTITNV